MKIRLVMTGMALMLVGCVNPTNQTQTPTTGSPDAEAEKAAQPLAKVYDAIYAIANAHPALVKAVLLGYGASPGEPQDTGLPVLALEIRAPELAAGTAAGDAAPRVQLISVMHGDEQIGAMLALDLARTLVGAYEAGDGTEACSLARSVALTIIPVVNPWGYEADTRENAEGTNLNRNFPWAWEYADTTTRGAAKLSAPESQILAADASAKCYALSVTLHSGGFCIRLPWDYVTTDPADYQTTASLSPSGYAEAYMPALGLFESEGSAYAARVGSVTGAPANSFFSEEGGDWYVICGSYADWLYESLGCPCFTLELSPYRGWTTLDASLGTEVIRAHEAALIGLLSSAGTGLRGRVLYATSNAAAAAIKVVASKVSKAKTLPEPVPYAAFGTTDSKGYFRIALPAGTWSLMAKDADGLASIPLEAVASSSPDLEILYLR